MEQSDQKIRLNIIFKPIKRDYCVYEAKILEKIQLKEVNAYRI